MYDEPIWVHVGFNYAGWIECGVCGYKPQSQQDMDSHVFTTDNHGRPLPEGYKQSCLHGGDD